MESNLENPETPKKEKNIFGFKRNIFFLGLVSLFNDVSSEMVQSVMPLFLTVTLGAPAFAVGIIEGASDALASILKFFSGWASDKTGKRKPIAVLGYAISVSTRAFLTFTGSFGQVFGLRAIDRVGKGLRDSPRDALIVESVERKNLGKSFGLHRTLDTIGATTGPLLAFFILPFINYDYRTLFIIAFFLGLLAIFSFVFVKDIAKKNKEENSVPRLKWKIFKERKNFVLIVVSLFIFGLGALPISLVLLKAKEGFSAFANVPLMYFVYSAIFVLTALPLGRLADKIGERKVIGAGFLFAIAAYLGLISSSGIFSIALSFAALGVYAASTDGLQRVLAAKHLPPELTATGQGFLNMAIGFSSLFAGLIGGLLWTINGSSVALLYATILSAIGFGLFLVVTKKIKINY